MSNLIHVHGTVENLSVDVLGHPVEIVENGSYLRHPSDESLLLGYPVENIEEAEMRCPKKCREVEMR
ncbi:MAG: hypothetical protein ACK56I_00260, partial [bacterium]